MTNSAESVRDTLTAIFKRRGGNGRRTAPFDELPEQERLEIAHGVLLPPSELGVLASIANPAQWVLVTTERLVWREHERFTELPLSRLREVTVDLEAERRAGVTSKDRFTRLRLMTAAGESFTISLEPGGCFFGIWNVLKHVADRNSARWSAPLGQHE
jgi:hypothetical protein